LDNLTHSLVGWTLGQTGLKRKTRKGLAATILGANMPDIDVFLGWVPWAPMATHRGFTHGIVGVALMPPILAGLLWLLDRWHLRRGEPFPSGLSMHFGWLVVLSYAGTLTHPLLDWQNSYAVQLLSPFSNLWFHNDALFIIDVWIWLALGLGIWLSRRREKRGAPRWGAPAIAALATVLLYIAGNGVLSARAKDAVIAVKTAARPERIFATPPPVAFWRRELVWRRRGTISFGAYDPLARGLSDDPPPPIADGMADPLARQGMTATRDLVAFMRWSLLPVARVERGRCGARVTYGDARYGTSVTENRFRRDTVVPIANPGC
jgi:inner membrane protein